MKHTPGPWFADKIEPGNKPQDEHWIIFDETTNLAKVYHQGLEWNEAQGNAHLIAAAPDLLMAAKRYLTKADVFLRYHYENDDTPDGRMLAISADRLEKAIAKAEGK